MHLKLLCASFREGLTKKMRIMKITAILLLTVCMGVSAKSISQTVTLSEKSAPLDKVFREIKKQTGYTFVYTAKQLAKAAPVTVNIRNGNIRAALDLCFRDQPLVYTLLDDMVIIKEKAVAAAVEAVQANAPPEKVKGKVTDAAGSPLIAATVVIKGTNKGVVTDANGQFEIDAETNAVLVISLIGFESKELTVGKDQMNVVLAPKQSELEQVVVVGYGVQKKVNLTGSVSSVSSKQLENRPVTSVSNALQGTMAGVTVTAANSGQPGKDGGVIRVRGIGTLNNSNAMVMVDGVISSMNNVNPDDIESISVLKDAASAAIYGSRAANGVILITTKKGKKGTPQIVFNSYVGKQQATYLPDFLPSWDAARLYNQALVNEGKPARYTDAEINKFRDGSDLDKYPNTDWLDIAYRGSGIQQNYYLGVSGGSDKSQYSFSLGMYDQEGLMEKTNSKRYTSRFNISQQLNDKLRISGNLAYTYSIVKEPQSSYPGVPGFTQIVRQFNRISPIVPYKFSNGRYGSISDGSPAAWLESSSYGRENYADLLGNVGADWEIVKGLHFKPSIAYTMRMGQTKSFVADIQYYNVNGDKTFYQGPNSVTDGNTTSNVVTLQDLLEYGHSFGKHNFKALAGYFQEYTKYTWNEGFRKNLLNNTLSQINLGSTDGQRAGGYAYEAALRSFFGRLNYDFDGKYLFEANIRRDGSSRFSPDNRWGTFPSFSAGWNVDREIFFTPIKDVVNNLKLRASWGELGNQTLTGFDDSNYPTYPYYPYITTVSAGQNYTFGGTSSIIAAGIAPVNGANSNIKWETTTESNVGLDAGFLDGRLSLTADWFKKRTTDILIAVPVGSVYGLNAPTQNAGIVENTGWEFTAGYNDRKGDFSWNATGNVSFINNKVIKFVSDEISGYTIKTAGLPINSLWGYVAEGIFQTQEEIAAHAKQSANTKPGDLKYQDRNGDKVIDTKDRQYLGNYYPKVTYGLNLGGSWKNIDLTLFFQGAAGVKTYMDAGKMGQIGSSVGKPTSALLNTWTPSNTAADLPRALTTQQHNDPSNTPSSFWVKDGSYLRLKNLQIGYTVPQNLLDRIGIKKARIFYSGQNILTFSGLYKWIDPEAPASSSIYYYPQVKVNTVGLNVTF
ncbi:SusC/RagA family TonB-linked outer membrane protein [Chitinophaga lutea]|uniref:SusC/RagA family TonB-linked outer membrane protein n=2 Tax=Chitinophaga lutea TaxID=2488634 RepID=A0A3N4Q8K5_9BACT|nr:SusC/RagA family TonB-linked outer membrane protein [Chitinophaga lutea]